MEGSYNKVFLLKRIHQSTIYLRPQIHIHWNKREVSPVKCNANCLHSSNNRKVLLAKGNVPAESYKYFIDILMTTVRYWQLHRWTMTITLLSMKLKLKLRNEIASCLEKAYADISCSDAARMLSIGAGCFGNGDWSIDALEMTFIWWISFECAGDVNAYAAERGWQIVGGRLQFRGADAENEEQGVSRNFHFLKCIFIFLHQVPSVQLANMAITYAREMEQIV